MTWPEVTLGDICQFKYGKSLPEAKRHGTEFGVFGSNGEVGRHCRALTSGPTIVIGRKGSFGEVAYSESPCWPIDTAYYVDRSSTAADLRWLYFRLRALGLTELNRAAAIPGLNRDDAHAQRLLLPPIEEQRRIGAVLDAADELRAQRRYSLAKLDDLVRAVFVEIFGRQGRAPVNPGPVGGEHPAGWSWVALNSVATLGTGHTPDRSVAEYWDGEISWVNLNEIRELDGQLCRATRTKITPAGVANSSAVIHPTGTVCFSRTASVGFVTVMAQPMTTSQDFVTWTCGDELDPNYLMHALLLSRETLRASSSGSTHKTIYVRDAERFSVLLPPKDRQLLFVERAEKIRAMASQVERQLEPLDTLFASLQQRAFAGQL